MSLEQKRLFHFTFINKCHQFYFIKTTTHDLFNLSYIINNFQNYCYLVDINTNIWICTNCSKGGTVVSPTPADRTGTAEDILAAILGQLGFNGLTSHLEIIISLGV